MDRHASVLIVGAGPVGLALGCALLKYGVDVQVLEMLQARNPTPRASHIHGRVLELLEGIDVVSSLSGRPTLGARIFSGRRLLIETRSDSLDTPYPYSLAIPQPEIEAVLEARLLAQGGSLRRGVTVRSMRPDQGIVCTDEGDFSGRFVAGCDGAGSVVRSSLGMSLLGTSLSQPLALADFDTPEGERLDLAHLHSSPDGITFRVPLRAGERIVVDLPAGHDAADAEQIASLACSRIGDLPLGCVRWVSTFRLHRRLVPRMRLGRVLLAGDAAHLHSPVGGQGMNTGLLDAMHLGWQLAAVCRGAADEALLDRWASERRAAAADSVSAAWWASAALRMRAGPLAWLRDRLMRSMNTLSVPKTQMTRWGIALDADAMSFWSRQLGAPPGTRGCRAPPREYVPGELTLVGFSALAPLGVAPRISARFGRDVPAIVSDGTRWGDPTKGWLALVRPDGIIAYIGGVAGLAPAIEAMLSGRTL